MSHSSLNTQRSADSLPFIMPPIELGVRADVILSVFLAHFGIGLQCTFPNVALNRPLAHLVLPVFLFNDFDLAFPDSVIAHHVPVIRHLIADVDELAVYFV
jgi:hypothetical protein